MAEKEEHIIPPVDRELIKSELTKDRFVANTNKGNNEIYIVNHQNSPNVLKEIGRLREEAFRSGGGGTGKSLDLDSYDLSERPYQQLLVFSPEDEEIIGGYRFIDCDTATNPDTGDIELSTANYFKFSQKFIDEYLPYTIELGRSWVQPMYQPSVNPRKGLFALANIWDGLSNIIDLYPNSKYFFGKVTMYPDYNSDARDLLLFFMHHYFPDKEDLLEPIHPLDSQPDVARLTRIFKGLEFADGFRLLQRMIRDKDESIPPLLNIYMNISPSMKTFGTAVNPDFGHVEETGILVTIEDIYEETRARHNTNRDL